MVAAQRAERQALSKFKSLVATPALTSTKLPATAVFAIRSRAGNVAGSALTVTGPSARTIGVPALAANEFHRIGKLEAGSTTTIGAAFDLYIDTGLGSYKKILRGA